MLEGLHRLLTHEADALVAAGNFTIVILLVTLGITLVQQLATKTYTTDLRMIMTGLLLECAGWTMHRAWYGTLRQLRENDVDISLWTSHTYVPFFFTCVIIMGLVLMLSPVVKSLTGWRCHPCWMIMGSWILYWIMYAIVKVI